MSDLLQLFFVSVFGLIIGSFLNVVIYRYNTGRGVGGRSMCMTCVRKLSWYELVPVFSYLSTRGRCRQCLTRISAQYPLVEIGTAILFALVWIKGGGATLVSLIWLVAVSLFVVISVYDYRHFIIPDGVVYTLVALGIVRLLVYHNALEADLVSGFVLFLFFAALWFFSKGRAMGFGDAKLALGIGWLVPFPFNVFAIIYAFYIGAIWGVVFVLIPRFLIRIRGKRSALGITSEIPFGPFLALGAILVFVYPIALW